MLPINLTVNGDLNQNLWGALVGDVTGNWTPAQAALAVNKGNQAQVRNDVEICVPDLEVQPGDMIRVPLTISGMDDGDEIVGFQYDLNYLDNLTYVGIEQNGTLTEEWTVNDYPSIDENRLIINGFSLASGIFDDGIFIYILFETAAESGSATIEFNQLMVNEGDPTVGVCAEMGEVVSVDPEETSPHAPTKSMLYQNIPNPFNPQTTIQFDTAIDGRVNLTIYDLQGHLIKTLTDDLVTAGSYQLVWNGKNEHGQEVPSGVYFYNLTTPDEQQTRQMILLR